MKGTRHHNDYEEHDRLSLHGVVRVEVDNGKKPPFIKMENTNIPTMIGILYLLICS